MDRFEKLELTVETLRELSDDELTQVAGGAASGQLCNLDTTYYVPSNGGAWTMMCPIVTN